MSAQLIAVIGLISIWVDYILKLCVTMSMKKQKKNYAAADHLTNILDTRKLFKNYD